MAEPQPFSLRFEFPGDGGRPEAVIQECPLYENVQAALAALRARVDVAWDFTTPGELQTIRDEIEQTRRQREAIGQPLLAALERSAPVLPRRFLFRGQADSRWALLPSLFQRLDWGPLPWTVAGLNAVRDAIVRRDRWTRQFSADFAAGSRAGVIESAIAAFNPVQLHLAARHYGFPSDFIDFTTDPAVAAFFATTGASPGRIGVLYALDLHRLQEAIGISATAVGPDGSLQVLFPANRIALPGANRSITMQAFRDLVFSMATAPLSRVRAQRAVFLDVGTQAGFTYDDPMCVFDEYWLWNALDFVSDKILFRQSGDQYEDPSTQLTRAQLLPPADPLDEFAEAWRQAHPLPA